MRVAAALFASLVFVVFLCGSARAADDPYAALLAPAGVCGAADGQPVLDPQTAQRTMLCLTNYARTQSGLAPLTLSATLNAAGNAKLAADVSCNQFSHEPCGQPFDVVFSGYTQGAVSYEIGENIAWGTGSLGTPRSIMDAWLHSAGHRENILTATFKEVGVGYIPSQSFLGNAGASLWSQEFGVRSSAEPGAPASTAPTPTTPTPPTTTAPRTATAQKPVAKKAKKKPVHKRRALRRRR
jgi:hypothetical protein